jgi:putative spermidine/putrescine transport system permease protein
LSIIATESVAARAWQRRGVIEAVAGYVLVAVPVLLLVMLVLTPTLMMIIHSFLVGPGNETGPGIGRYVAFFSDAYSVANLKYTVLQTTVSCITALTISFFIALYLRFSTGRIASIIHALSLFPLFVPAIIVSYSLIRFLGPNGLLQLLLTYVGITHYQTPYLTPVGPYIAFVWENLPLPVLVISAGLAQVSDHAIEAARDLGAGALRILLEILLPQVKRSIMIAFALIFLGVIGSFTVPYLLGPPAPEMMGVFMMRTFSNLIRPEEAEVQAVILLTISSLVSLVYIMLMNRGTRS